MENELGDYVKLIIALRNRLIHRYLIITPEELWQMASKLILIIIPKFKEWVLDVVKAHEESSSLEEL